ncbi:MAG: ScyD/ScyE family protein [Chthoniobacterales bacterium]
MKISLRFSLGRLLLALGVIFTFGVSVSVLAAGPDASNDTYTVIVSGLHAPRGLTFGPGDRLYVAEAGQGGDPVAYNGAIDEIVNPQSDDTTLRTVVDGIASLAADGDIIGLGQISAPASGGIYAIVGESPQAIGVSAFGELLQATSSGKLRSLTNVGGANYVFTKKHPELDPGGQFPDANPYGVFVQPQHVYVVDAGANTLCEVLPNGRVKILAFFANNLTADSTPTCLAQGPDGALYVCTLSLVDSLVFGPSAIVYRVVPDELPPQAIIGASYEWATGLWPINGCAFGPDGSLYVSELITASDFSGGDVVKIPFDDPANHISLTGATLPFGGGVSVASDGTVYAVGLTVSGTDGFVARLTEH